MRIDREGHKVAASYGVLASVVGRVFAFLVEVERH
jgi:hypothetical protein